MRHTPEPRSDILVMVMRKHVGALVAMILAIAIGACLARYGARGASSPSGSASPISTIAADASASQSSIAQPTAATFTLLTFNIFVGNRDLGAVVDLLRRADATIVCLQETIPASQALLRRELSNMYPAMEFAVGRVGNGPGFLAKQPLETGRYVASVEGYNGFYFAKLKIAGRMLQVVNAHLHPTVPTGGIRGLFRGWGASEAVRLSEIAQFDAALDSTIPAVLAGDLNTLSSSRSYQELLERGFVDDAAATAESTFHGLPIGVRIDFVMQRGPLRLISSRVITPSSSDHNPVLATFAWR